MVAGQEIIVRAPNGVQIQCTVPEGVGVGQRFQVTVPSNTPMAGGEVPPSAAATSAATTATAAAAAAATLTARREEEGRRPVVSDEDDGNVRAHG